MTGERDLVERYLRLREEESFRSLYRLHTPALYRVAWRMTGGSDDDASDIVQETWVRAARSLDRFAWRSSLRTWLIGITINLARELYRSNRHACDVPLEDLVHRMDPIDERLDLERAIAELPAGYREVLILHSIEGFTHKEIAAMLGIEEGTSKSQLFHARKAVRLLIDTSGG